MKRTLRKFAFLSGKRCCNANNKSPKRTIKSSSHDFHVSNPNNHLSKKGSCEISHHGLVVDKITANWKWSENPTKFQCAVTSTNQQTIHSQILIRSILLNLEDVTNDSDNL